MNLQLPIIPGSNTASKRQAKLEKDLKHARSYNDWKAVAQELDEVTGLNDWKRDNESPYYDYQLIADRLTSRRCITPSQHCVPTMAP